MITAPDITRIAATDPDSACIADWFVIMKLPVAYGPPEQVGRPIFGRDNAEKMRQRLSVTGVEYVLFGWVE